MTTAISPQDDLFRENYQFNPISSAIFDILNNDSWIWENNPIVQGFPCFEDDTGFEAVEPDTTRMLLKSAMKRFEVLFDAINGREKVNRTRAKVALTGLLISTSLVDSPLLGPSMEAAAAFYGLCENPTFGRTCTKFLFAHARLTVALMKNKNQEAIDDAWQFAFAYHGKYPLNTTSSDSE